jgi:hypothetical protein
MALTDAKTPIEIAVEELDDDGVLKWRFEALRHAGYSAAAAAELACAPDVDLHVAVDLVARGCDHATALRILL